MKTRFSRVWGMTLTVAALPFVGGCLQDAANASGAANTAFVSTNIAGSNTFAVPDANQSSDTNSVVEAIPLDEDPLAQAPVKPISAPTPPPAVATSAAAAEVVKLANSAVDEGVMLAYVTNSTSRFNLTADQIVYLNDLGVPPSVVTAMIQRDQVSGVGPAVPIAPLAQTAATNYASPNPADVAPQAIAPEGGQAQVLAAPSQPVDNNTFYTALSPYGTWMEVEGYGMVWQPTVTVINTSWRPYFDSGRWVSTDAGWYWHSDYSWGWAPFHYGRWFRHHRVGWCWAPDTVWGPSWVSWRYDTDYCGWAPLPPAACYRPGFGFSYYGRPVGWSFSFGLGYSHYSFVHFSHFHSHRLHHHRVRDHHSEHVYHNSRPSSRMPQHRNLIVNEGPPVGTVSRHTDVRKVVLREQPASRAPGRFPSERAERLEGKTLTVYKPAVAPLPSPTTTLAAAGNTSRRMPGGSSALPASTAARPGSSLVDRGSVTPPRPPGGSTQPSSAANGSSRFGSSLVNRDNIAAPKPAAPATPMPNPAPTPLAGNSSSRMPNASGVRRLPQESVATPSTPQTPAAAVTRPDSAPTVTGSSGSSRFPNRLVQTPAAAPARTPETAPAPATPTRPAESVAPLRSAVPSTVAPSSSQREFPGSRLASRPTVAPMPAPVTQPRSTASVEAPRAIPAAPAASAPSAAPASPWSARSSSRSSTTYAPAPAPTPAPAQAPSYNYSAPARMPSAPAPSYSAPRAQVPVAPAPAPSYSAPARSAPSYSAPSYSAPSRMPSAPAPAPVIRAPSPSYSAPARMSSPAPQMSAPSAPRSMPSPSAASRSSDSGRSSGRFGR